MIDVDFLFVYEIKNREIENICLLKYELEKRGYTTAFLNMWETTHYKYPKYNAKVIVAFGVYDNSQAGWFPYFGNRTKKMVNLQWEQLFSTADEESETTVCFTKEKAVNAVHVAWGKFNVDRLINRCKVKEDHVVLAGHMAMDFLKPRFKGYYMDKEELCKKYSIDPKKQMYLFISSFAFQSMPENELTERAASKLAIDPFEQRRLCIESQKSLLEWLENTLKQYPDIEFIYRPHPAELEVDTVLKLEEKCQNFHIISDYSVKQWITTSDKIYTWISTSVAEVYAAGKTCSVVRPIPIKEGDDIRLFIGCDAITNEKDFMDTFMDKNDYPIDVDMLKYYYKIDDEYSYEIICDKLEEVLLNDKYEFDFVEKKSFLNKVSSELYHFIRSNVAREVAKMYLSGNKIITKLSTAKSTKAIIEDAIYAERMIINQVASDEEIAKHEQYIKKILESNLKNN